MALFRNLLVKHQTWCNTAPKWWHKPALAAGGAAGCIGLTYATVKVLNPVVEFIRTIDEDEPSLDQIEKIKKEAKKEDENREQNRAQLVDLGVTGVLTATYLVHAVVFSKLPVANKCEYGFVRGAAVIAAGAAALGAHITYKRWKTYKNNDKDL